MTTYDLEITISCSMKALTPKQYRKIIDVLMNNGEPINFQHLDSEANISIRPIHFIKLEESMHNMICKSEVNLIC